MDECHLVDEAEAAITVSNRVMSRAVKRVILPCQNGYYDSNIKVLLLVVKEIEKLRYHY